MPLAPNKAKPVICYAKDSLPELNKDLLRQLRQRLDRLKTIRVAARSAEIVAIEQGQFFRICVNQGPQVGDLNIWCRDNLYERFYSGKTRQLHATHVSTYDRLWSNLPYLRPLATISYDTLGWYGFDADGAGVHDVIGTRCDPYTHQLLTAKEYDFCCHSNLCRALANYLGEPIRAIEQHVHDVLNVFMCTGFDRQTHQYFMKASPAVKGDYLEFFAECDLLIGLSACSGGDCSTQHSSDRATCFDLDIEIYQCRSAALKDWQSIPVSGYCHPESRLLD